MLCMRKKKGQESKSRAKRDREGDREGEGEREREIERERERERERKWERESFFVLGNLANSAQTIIFENKKDPILVNTRGTN